jgi:magnesium-transporting ATPase (P-type)
VTIYLKGAPEQVLSMCQTIQGNGKYEILNDDMANDMNERINAMAAHPYRVMAFAYAEMDTNQWVEQFKNTGKEMEFEQAIRDKSIQFTFLAAFGL